MNQRIARLTCASRIKPPVMHKAGEETRQHQPHCNLGVDTGPAVISAIKAAYFSAKPPKIEDMIDLHQNVVIGNRTPQRPVMNSSN